MKEKRCEQIVLCKDYYDDEEHFFKDTIDTVKILLKNNYLCLVRYDEPDLGILVIEYNHNDNLDDWGGYMPEWLDEDETFYAYNYKDYINKEEVEQDNNE